MKEAMNKFDNAVNELMDVFKGEIGRLIFDLNVEYDDSAITRVRSSFALMDAAMELTRAQTNMMIEMDKKLDRLVENNN